MVECVYSKERCRIRFNPTDEWNPYPIIYRYDTSYGIRTENSATNAWNLNLNNGNLNNWNNKVSNSNKVRPVSAFLLLNQIYDRFGIADLHISVKLLKLFFIGLQSPTAYGRFRSFLMLITIAASPKGQRPTH